MRMKRRNSAAGRSPLLLWLLPVVLPLVLSGCDAGGRSSGGETLDSDPARNPGVVEPVSKRSPFGNFLAGRFAERQRDYERAAIALNRALEENPENLGLKRRAFFVSLQSGRVDAALSLAHDLEKSELDVPTAQLLLAAESVRNGDYTAALKRLDRMERADLSRYSVPLAMAWAHAGAKETDSALAALGALDESTGFGPLRDMHEALINDMAGRPGPAEAGYRGALGDDPSQAPVRAIRAYGNFFERQGRRAEATELYKGYRGQAFDNLMFEQDLERAAGGDTPEPVIAAATDGLAESFFDIASVLPKERAGEIILLYVRLALYLKPDFPLAQLLLGDVLDTYQRYGEAAGIYRDIDPKSPYGWVARLRLADDLYDVGKVDEAASVLRRMSDERPARSDALIRLGNILRYEERFDESVKVYDQAIERIGTVERDNWTLLYSRGIALERAGLWERAEADFLRALELEPDQPFVLNYLGYSWVEKGLHLKRARKMLESAVAQRQDDGYIVDSMGWALYKLGEYAEAVDFLERAVALLPQDPVINDHLGDGYWRVGRTEEAHIQWRRVLGLEPEEDLAGIVGEKLRRGLPPRGAEGTGG